MALPLENTHLGFVCLAVVKWWDLLQQRLQPHQVCCIFSTFSETLCGAMHEVMHSFKQYTNCSLSCIMYHSLNIGTTTPQPSGVKGNDDDISKCNDMNKFIHAQTFHFIMYEI